MKTISKIEYENETNLFILKNKLVDINFSKVFFAKTAIYAAKYVYDLVGKKYLSEASQHKKDCLNAISIAEKYLQGEVTQRECYEVAAYTTSKATNSSVIASAVISACANAAYAAAYAATDATDATFANAICACSYVNITNYTSAGDISCDFLRRSIPWNLVCSFQIAKCFGNEKDEQFIQNIAKNENLINYATILLEDENLREEFEFLMKNYMNK